MINPVFLKTFLTLSQCGHFTETAQKLNMTQPGVSHHIHKIEEYFGVSVLHRFGKKFELTPEGEAIKEYALNYLKKEDELRESLSHNLKTLEKVKIACSGPIANQIYYDLIQFQKQETNLSVCIEAAPNSNIFNLIRANEIDLGIVTLFTNDPYLNFSYIGDEDLCLFIPKGQPHTWENLLRLGFINHPDGYHYASQVLGGNYVDDFKSMDEIPVSGYINQISQILLPVSEGIGFTVLPKLVMGNFVHKNKVEAVNLKNIIKEKLYLVSKKNKPLPARYANIMKYLNHRWKS